MTHQYVGCATINPDGPKLWIVCGIDDTQGFSLAEVIEAGLRQKIVGLSDADRDAAIADCVTDALGQIRDMHGTVEKLERHLRHRD